MSFRTPILTTLASAALLIASPPILLSETKGAAPKKAEANEASALVDFKNSKEPIFINSDSLSINQNKRTFVYTGNVQVTQGDMTITAATLDGKYDQKNEIEQLIARKDVVITKGPSIRATSNRAVYEAAKGTVTLTENPQIHQDGSILSADVVRIFLQENRSVAEGQVRMKLVKASPTPAAAAPAVPTKQRR
jgi:lipopolysaccharide export system protein LptA